jgi:hypothetical protein
VTAVDCSHPPSGEGSLTVDITRPELPCLEP